MLIYSYCIIGREESAIYNGGIMLDDMNVIAQRDTQGLLEAAKHIPDRLMRVYDVPAAPSNIVLQTIVVWGDAAAIPAKMMQVWPEISVPIIAVTGSHLPPYIGEHTLCIVAGAGDAVSDQLRSRKAQVVELSHDEMAMSTTYATFRALVDVCIAYTLADVKILNELESAVASLKKVIASLQKTTTTDANPAKQIALQLVGKTTVIYSGPAMMSAAHAWKRSINAYAKNTAWCGELPAQGTTEYAGWTSHPIEKPFAVVDLVSSFEHDQVLEQFVQTDRALSGRRPKAVSVHAAGDSTMEHVLFLMLLGEFTSLYLSILNGVDPSSKS